MIFSGFECKFKILRNMKACLKTKQINRGTEKMHYVNLACSLPSEVSEKNDSHSRMYASYQSYCSINWFNQHKKVNVMSKNRI